jgi:hypothetical protein
MVLDSPDRKFASRGAQGIPGIAIYFYDEPRNTRRVIEWIAGIAMAASENHGLGRISGGADK